jgi:ABC-type nitrate/sulfonate/bicarbonate transport system permease component
MNAAPTTATSPVRSALIWLGQQRVLAWAAVIGVLVAWELIVAIKNLNPIYLPRPSRIVVTLVDMFANGGLAFDLAATLGCSVSGWRPRSGSMPSPIISSPHSIRFRR